MSDPPDKSSHPPKQLAHSLQGLRSEVNSIPPLVYRFTPCMDGNLVLSLMYIYPPAPDPLQGALQVSPESAMSCKMVESRQRLVHLMTNAGRR